MAVPAVPACSASSAATASAASRSPRSRGNDISLQTADGWTRTITVDSGTTYMQERRSDRAGDLQVGDEIGFRQTHETDGSFTIDSIVVILPHAGGEVTAVIRLDHHASRPARRHHRDDHGHRLDDVHGQRRAARAWRDVKVGMVLIAEGTKNADGSLTATRVRAAALSNIEGRGFGHRKFRAGPNGEGGTSPDATTAPSATGSAG